ncbi:MAG: Aconitate hydratase A [Phycisphaerae bacterium]|nr:Aconitate hydratase A [Phycisphaerae bacterium]
MAFADELRSIQKYLSLKKNRPAFFSLNELERRGLGQVSRLPFSIRVLLESALRNFDNYVITEQHVLSLIGWKPKVDNQMEIPFLPARVILQDFTGVPAVVDLAAMRSAMVRMGADPKKINPRVPVDLVIDHSVQVDHFGSDQSLGLNVQLEFSRNQERYEFLHWGQKVFDHFRIVPPNTGIVHQVNLEYLAQVATTREVNGQLVALPDSLVGTDSHTTMINGLGVVGWGVGGIEAEAVMLNQPIYMLTPQVIGFRLFGALPTGATATDLVLTITEILRKKGVVDKFVEFFGNGLESMSLADRATIANMAPEYGATMGFFPVDDETLHYLRRTGRSADQVELVEAYYKEQGLFRTAATPDPLYTDTVELDLATVVPSLAGPKRPQDRVVLTAARDSFRSALQAPVDKRGYALSAADLQKTARVQNNGHSADITHGAVVIAAITSCTNTSNPSVMLAAGLLAKKAVERGLHVPPYVKTSLAPGSRVVTDYLDQAGLSSYLNQLGFNTVGYGCTTCIGNSGPLPEPVVQAINQGNLVACSVLSGNRNFEGRVHPNVKANYLASPPLVVAYALAGTLDKDLTREPLGHDQSGQPVYLQEIWPTPSEISALIDRCVTPELFARQYGQVTSGSDLWNRIKSPTGDVYQWNPHSTYIQEPPFFQQLAAQPAALTPIRQARVLAWVADSVTTDHISPAGSIKADSPAGRYLQDHGVKPVDFNSYGSRRGNDRVMTRGTFANIRLKNLLLPGTEGGMTRHLPSGQTMAIYDAAELYHKENTPLIILAGQDYGMGSSRDWAAKGTLLLGVKAVIAKSYERIHRSNLVGMGVLPLQFVAGQDAATLGLTGSEPVDIPVSESLQPQQPLEITARRDDGATVSFTAIVRIDTPVELDYYRHGGILPMVLRQMLKG